MICRKLLAGACLASLGVVMTIGAFALAQPSNDSKPAAGGAGAPEMQLPPGWTQDDVQACMMAATPGEQHKILAQSVGTWHGQNTMWMFPGAEPIKSESKMVVTPMMDGRYVKFETSGDMPGMGTFEGFGINAFDNVTGEFVTTWIDNMGTGIATGKGQLSADGKTLTWQIGYNCPITKKPTVMRQVETTTGPDTKTFDMWSIDPKSGKEFHVMKIELTKK